MCSQSAGRTCSCVKLQPSRLTTCSVACAFPLLFHLWRHCGGGMSLIEIARDHHNDPLDVVERMASGNNWPFERTGEDEIGIVVTGRWTNYQCSFTWMDDIEALHLACAFDMRVPDARLTDVQRLIAMIN